MVQPVLNAAPSPPVTSLKASLPPEQISFPPSTHLPPAASVLPPKTLFGGLRPRPHPQDSAGGTIWPPMDVIWDLGPRQLLMGSPRAKGWVLRSGQLGQGQPPLPRKEKMPPGRFREADAVNKSRRNFPGEVVGKGFPL